VKASYSEEKSQPTHSVDTTARASSKEILKVKATLPKTFSQIKMKKEATPQKLIYISHTTL
jgi:hypothetical protein